ncbi:MAG TPA: hypothetical protein VN493_17415 [Thermoanaerobaculia bacterium]|nr:hypothetical protein [Thermoanaerobaculia bacterium]
MENRTVIRSTTALLVLLFVASFISPALCNQREGEVCSEYFRGYLAAMGSLMSIRNLSADPEELAADPVVGLYVATAWVANIPFILVSLQLLISPQRRRLKWAVVATILAAVDAWLLPFVFMSKSGSVQDLLLPGYWLWALSLSFMAVWTFAVNRAWNRSPLP